MNETLLAKEALQSLLSHEEFLAVWDSLDLIKKVEIMDKMRNDLILFLYSEE